MVALRHLSKFGFANASGTWCGACLQLGQVFQDKSHDLLTSGNIYVSLGFHCAAAILWEVQEVQEGVYEVSQAARNVEEDRDKLRYVCITTISKTGDGDCFEGVPVEVCSLTKILALRVC